MNPNAEIWFHEAKVAHEKFKQSFSATNSVTASEAMNLGLAAEYAVKGLYAEMGVPNPRVHGLCTLCSSLGIYGKLPAEYQSLVMDLDSFGPGVRYPNEPSYVELTTHTNPDEWGARIRTTEGFIDYLETNANSLLP